MSKTLTINEVRISYPQLFTAKQINNQGDPKYSAAFLIPETHPALKKLFGLAEQAVNEKYPDGNLPHKFKTLPCYKASENPKYAGKPEYAGMWILNSSKGAAQGAPQVVDQQMNKVLNPSQIYPGMVVNVAVSIYTYDHSMAKGVTTGLEAVQIVRDGERLDDRPSADELFKPIDVQEGSAGGGLNPFANSGGGGNRNPLG